MIDLKTWSEKQLLNAIYINDLGSAATGGLAPIEYIKELNNRNPEIKLHHSEMTVLERLIQEERKEKKERYNN